ncbi:uncharacterized protein LOC144700493 isoform X2 [Wolffia australiana]
MHGSRGCLGCWSKPSPIIAVDEPSKGLKIRGRTVKKSSFSDDLPSSSTYDMDNHSAVLSQRSVSSVGPDSANPAGSDFVNHGLLLWNQTRRQWRSHESREKSSPAILEPGLSWNATYDGLLGSSKPFPRPIPLSEMVDFLVDVWEQEGLFD